MKKFFIYILIFLSLAALGARFGYQPLLEILGFKARGGITITSIPDGAVVLIDGIEVGRTPYNNETMSAREYELKLIKEDISWQGSVKLTKGTLTVVNRELASATASSSGEILTLDIGKGALITSGPSGASVEIDGKDYGNTPLRVTDLTPGGHTFLLSYENYLKRSIKVSLPPKMILHLDVDLAISEVNLNNTAASVVVSAPKLTVKQTPTGFLRVRDKPSALSREVGRVSPGESLILLEELSGWDRVRLDNGVEGYVSRSYIQKQ